MQIRYILQYKRQLFLIDIFKINGHGQLRLNNTQHCSHGAAFAFTFLSGIETAELSLFNSLKQIRREFSNRCSDNRVHEHLNG